jgi:hypothetical protein
MEKWVLFHGQAWWKALSLLAFGKAGLLVLTEWQITTQWRNWVPVLGQSSRDSPKEGLTGEY